MSRRAKKNLDPMRFAPEAKSLSNLPGSPENTNPMNMRTAGQESYSSNWWIKYLLTMGIKPIMQSLPTNGICSTRSNSTLANSDAHQCQ